MVQVPVNSPAKLVRALAVILGEGTVIFNDHLKSGLRSIKVWRWKKEHYELAQDLLEKHGYISKIVEPTKFSSCRLHVSPVRRTDLKELISQVKE